jgi:lipid-A-disaccharide synthase
MLVIFPVEEAFYRETGVPVTFVGHPLVDLVRPAEDRGAFLAANGLDPDRPILAVLPGSRHQEVAHNLPPLAGAIRLLAERRPALQFALPLAPSLSREPFCGALAGLPVSWIQGQAHSLLGACDAALVASGTATVEAALLGTPMAVVYRISAVSYLLGRPFVTVPHYAMVNLVAGRRVVPEIIQRHFTPQRVAGEALSLLEDEARRGQMKRDLQEVRQKLGGPGASGRAARALLEVLEALPSRP